IGFPRAMYFFDRLPFWSTFIGELGFRMVLSDPTNKKISAAGIESVVAEPCYPIKVTHGHVLNLMEKKPDYILLPSMLTSESRLQTEEEKKKSVGRKMSYFCPWGQTVPEVIKGNQKFSEYADRFLLPRVELREGDEFVISDFYSYFKTKFGGITRKQVSDAYYRGKAELETFRTKLNSLYIEAMGELRRHDREAVVLIGRPYNVNDVGINLNLAAKLRDLYGVNVIPIDAVTVPDENIDDVNNNMFWGYGTKILSTMKHLRNFSNVHIIYITNFQCGPDSYIKHFAPEALGKSYLTLQFDGHGNDAGMLTRCEAYLDSKGVFGGRHAEEKFNLTGDLR
ncbi:MAG: hypothetical protein JXA66_02030, partial [Oligoflexia bacterium]|nr:hypothetical protein [Oligoflexia bacterium]